MALCSYSFLGSMAAGVSAPPPAGGTFESIIDECSSRLVGSTVYILVLRTASEGEGGHGKADVVREVA